MPKTSRSFPSRVPISVPWKTALCAVRQWSSLGSFVICFSSTNNRAVMNNVAMLRQGYGWRGVSAEEPTGWWGHSHLPFVRSVAPYQPAMEVQASANDIQMNSQKWLAICREDFYADAGPHFLFSVFFFLWRGDHLLFRFLSSRVILIPHFSGGV